MFGKRWEKHIKRIRRISVSSQSCEQFISNRVGKSDIHISSRITPEYISKLQPDEVLVFGSNARGMHYGGAVAFAVKRFGAIMGQGEGLQGQSYAIPTMEGMENMRAAMDKFVAFAQEHPELIFFVTPIGCGIAGYTPEDMAPLFAEAKTLNNVHLPESFWKCITE